MRLIYLILSFFIVFLSNAQNLKIAAPLYSPPFSLAIDQKNHFVGFDIDIMDNICRRISANCQYVPTEHELEFPAVLAGKVDLAIGNITITSERQATFLFSLPYLASYAQYITRSQSNINGLNDLSEHTIGLENLAAFEKVIDEKFGKNVNKKTYHSLPALLEGLTAGEVDAAILDQATAQTWAANSDNNLRLIGAAIPFGLGYGVLTNKGNQDLISKINQALLNMENDGTYTKIYNTYFNGIAHVGY